MVTILSSASQNSVSPNSRTVPWLIANSSSRTQTAGIHCGSAGNQACSSSPTAVTSAMHTTIIVIQ